MTELIGTLEVKLNIVFIALPYLAFTFESAIAAGDQMQREQR